ncbi:MAG: Tannase and feruloyl esterase [Acidobacteria bacterium]|nr:Tannase and feruloyl esterase [Acidobacteriota bacterium]
MKTRVLLGVAIAIVLSGVSQDFRPAALSAADHGDCAALTQLKLPDITITEAAAVAASATGITRPHCRVAGVIGTEIKFSLLMPDTWNHKFLMGGGGGFVGTVQNQAQFVVNAGYATAGTDTGHSGGTTDATWALNNIERQVNFGYLGVHRTAEAAKAILRRYYGSPETRAYFSGCSNGGRQALMEAQRFPDDFDGIVAGAPAADFTGIGAQFIKDVRAQFPDPKDLTPLLAPETMQAVAAQILDKCDALDGVKDGVMEDPRRCTVDVSTLTGLSAAQIAALKTIYAPTHAGSETVFPGQPFGGEGEAAGWPAWISGPAPRQGQPAAASLRYGFGTQLFKYLVFNDPDWDYTKYDLSTWRKDTVKTASFLNATSPDLDAFKAKGHKLLLWHGWADAGLSPLGTIKYYESVQARDPKLDEYVKMFLMPGVLHCGGGTGPDNADWAAAIDAWVESGQAPTRLLAQKGGATPRTRPLCAYPQHAVYNGSGSTDQAENFVCK